MPECSKDFTDELNNFYCRFDIRDFTAENTLLDNSLANVSLTDNVTINEADVRNVFSGLKLNKAVGPDGISNRILKSCSHQLANVLTSIFQMTLDEGSIPKNWKMSMIVPVPKQKKATVLNDYRPIALTSNIMKCLERLITRFLTSQASSFLDNLQFAYRQSRGVDDAVLVYLHKLYNHLDSPRTHVRSLFIDFSSAFNTIQPHILAQKLLQMNISPQIVRWIHGFLRDRPQWVKVGGVCSDVKYINTGVPQGCVISPLLFLLYTSDCLCSSSNCSIIKYADDTVITGYLKNDSTEYVTEVMNFIDWCNRHYLSINVQKTKEMIFDFRRGAETHDPLTINNCIVERVNEYKYLGTVVDDQLNWNRNTETIYSKANQRLYFLRKLKKFHVDRSILRLFYQSLIQSVLTFNLICTYGLLSQQSKKKFDRVKKNAQRIIGLILPSLDIEFETKMVAKLSTAMKDPTHPLFNCFVFNRSGIRLRPPQTKSLRFRQSFVPNSIHLFNSLVKR